LPVQRVISLVPAHHIYGFIWGILLAREFNLKPLEHQSATRALHGGLRPGDLIVGLPLWWKYLARSNARFPQGVIGVTSTAPMDVDVWRSLEQQGLQALFEVYGASELGGIGLRSHWESPFELLDCWQSTNSDADRLKHQDGHFSVRLPDHLEFTEPRHFWLRGRKDRQVQVAGINVCPEAISRRLLQLEGVVSCQVRLMTAAEGDRLKAWLETDHVLSQRSRAAIRDWCTRNFSAPERPHLTFTVHKSENALGKAVDWPINPDTEVLHTAADGI
jgi:4-coumarate--CoA ligase (photoactive yellow protein activation family)